MPENSNGHKQSGWWIVGAIAIPIALATFGKVMQTTINNAENLAEIQGEFKERKYRLDKIEKKLDQLIRRLEVLD